MSGKFEEDKDVKAITVKDKVLVLRVKTFQDEIDVDSILQIDYQNLIAEMISFPVLVNKLGLLVADCENKITERKLDTDIYEAKLKEQLREEMTEEVEDVKGKTKYNKPTIEALDNAVKQDKVWQMKKKLISKAQKERDYINSVYWSAQDKSRKLDKLSLTIQPDSAREYELPYSINGIDLIVKKV